jgi:DNA-binding CsgD family transcriptional regulator
MIRDDEHWLALTDAFHSAGLGAHSWEPALEGIAQATGSTSGQLIGLGSNAAVPFNLMTNADPAFAEHFALTGGGDPEINCRVKAGASAPPLKVLAEADYLTEDEYDRDLFLQQLDSLWGFAFSCLTTLERRSGLLVGLAVLRTRREGHISTAQREAFTALAPHARAAVRTQLALQGQGAELLMGAMERLSLAAFVCDQYGYVRALTPAAEALVANGKILQLTSSRLRAARPSDARTLDDAIDAATAVRVTPPSLRTVILHSEQGSDTPLVLDIVDLPARHCDFGFGARTLVIARGNSQTDGRKAAIVRAAFQLSAAETDVALQLGKGRNAETIARTRRVAIGTVRAQIKNISAKLGVKSQIELVAKLNQL